jgi:polar amino acid transport system substrate-binding protein
MTSHIKNLFDIVVSVQCNPRNDVKRFCRTCLLFLSVSSPALALDKPILKAVTAEDNYPYNFKKDDRIQGLGFDVVNTLAERTGYRLKVEALPWTRALLTAKNEAEVLIFSIVRIAEREEFYYWIGPIAKSEIWFYKLKNRTDMSVKNMADVRRYQVGDTASNATLHLLVRHDIKVDTAPSDLSNCRKFKIGRVELIPLDPRTVPVFSQACDIPFEQMEKTILLANDINSYIALGKNTSPEFIARLNSEFNAMVKDKTLQKISNQWTPLSVDLKKR